MPKTLIRGGVARLNHKLWDRLRREQLRRYPMCQCPHCKGMRYVATVVDHVIPHCGDPKLFYNARNLQSMAKSCHDKFKQSQEAGGYGFEQGVNELGEPLHNEHPFYNR